MLSPVFNRVVTSCVIFLGATFSVQADDRPNILFIFSDDHAVNAISAYGSRLQNVAPTPHIDRIAREGAIFRNSFCANSICGPSRSEEHTSELQSQD